MRRSRSAPASAPALAAAAVSDISPPLFPLAADTPSGKSPPSRPGRGLESMPPAATRARGRGRLSADEAAGDYLFQCGEVGYQVRLGSRETPSPLLRIDARLGAGEWSAVCAEAGMLLRDGNGVVHSPAQAAEQLQVTELRASLRGKTLGLRYVEHFGPLTLRRTLQLRLVGESLVIQLAAEGVGDEETVRQGDAAKGGPGDGPPPAARIPGREAGGGRQGGKGRGRRGARAESHPLPVSASSPPIAAGYCGFSFGTIGGTGARETLIPYTIDPIYLLENGVSAAAYVDRFLSSASACPRGAAFYRSDSQGRCGPIAETLYVSAAAEPLEALPLLDVPASHYREELARRVVLDLWSEAPFATDLESLARLRRYGLADLLIHYQTWQQHGGGRRLPAIYPANPERGGNEELRRLIDWARSRGWRVALREDYSALSPESAYWDPQAVARASDGELRPAMLPGFAVAAGRMLPFARLESSQIERNFRPGAASIGAGGAYNPEDHLHQIDMDARHKDSRTMGEAIRDCQELFRYVGGLHGGPVVGEGGDGPGRFDTFYAGVVDGFERPLDDGASSPVIVDYELRRVQPVMANHGVGHLGRFFRESHGPASVDGSRSQRDLYRATEIAFGHAGFLSTEQVPAPSLGPWVPLGSMQEAFNEYFLMRAVQEPLMLSPVRRIQYFHAGELFDLAGAMKAGLDFTQAQLRIEYERGLTVFVNRHSRQEWRIRWSDLTYTLPPAGWLVGDGRELLAYSALVAGNRADLVRSPAYTFLNVRSDVARRIEGITADGAVALVRSQVPGRRDLFVCGCKAVTEQEELLKLSERADFSLIYRSEREIELCVLDSENGQSVNVTVAGLGPEWVAERLQLEEREAGEWRRAPNQIQPTRRGLQFARLRPDVVYRLAVREEP